MVLNRKVEKCSNLPGSQARQFRGSAVHTEFFLNPCWGPWEAAAPKPKYAPNSRFFFVPVVRFQTRPKWTVKMTTWEPCLKLLQFLKAKAIIGKENNSFRGIMCAYKCLLWPFSKFNHQALWELAGLSTPGDCSFHLSKPELKNRISWRWQQKVAGLRTQYSFPGWWRVSKCGSKTKWGKSETLSNLTWWLLAKARKCREQCWVVMVQKGSWGGGRKKQHPSIKVGEKI